jgi:uncharacterized protein (DUF885 family)
MKVYNLAAATAVLAVMLGAGCSKPASDRPVTPAMREESVARVNALADEYVTGYFDAFPYQALTSGAPDTHPDQLVDHSLPALARWQAREDQLLLRLKEIDLSRLEGTPAEVTYKFLQNQIESAQKYRGCRIELWNVSPTYTGWQADFAVAAGLQATATEADQQRALARYGAIPKYLDDEIANLQEGLRLGYRAARVNVEAVIGQMDAMLAARPADSPFVQMAKKDAAAFRTQLEALETASIRPAIRKYRDFLKTTYLPASRDDVGVSANPGGAACYAASVRQFATVDMTPQQVHDVGRAQMDRIEAEMREIGTRSFGIADPATLIAKVKTDPQYRFKSREELIAYARSAVERARLALPQAFGRLPKAPVVVEPYPPYLEKTAPGGQSVPPTADGQPGKYLINAYNASEQSRAGLESTAFHETYPGHHLQGAIALERQGLHRISQYFFLSGFGEGWGLYAERLAMEMNLYTSDVDRLGELSNEALRAARLVVDAGMHGLGMRRQDAVDYMLAHTTATPAFANAEINRYIAVPGQATAYMIGNLEIRKLRTEAEQALGPKFDLKAFHDLVLEDGTLPLWVLREKVERWTRSKAAGHRP